MLVDLAPLILLTAEGFSFFGGGGGATTFSSTLGLAGSGFGAVFYMVVVVG